MLVGISKLVAPIAPFISDEIYINLTNDITVHTAKFPETNNNYIDNKLEDKMDLVRSLISVGRKVREENKIKVRQPLSEMLLDAKNNELLKDLIPLIEEELNVKEVNFVTDLTKYMDLEVKPNFKEVGKLFGSKINSFKSELESLSLENITALNKNECIEIELDGETITVTPEMTLIRVSAKEGFNVGTENNNFVVLNTNLTNDLINEGIAREFVSKIQNTRKEMDLDVSDRINIKYNSEDNVIVALTDFEEYIKKETLASELILEKKVNYDTKLNEYDLKITIEKI